MKKNSRARIFLSALLACALLIGSAIPAYAATDTADRLFREGLGGSEAYAKIRIGDDESDADYDDDYEAVMEEIPVIIRSSKASVTVKKNAKLIEEVALTIKKGHTLTIEEGVTLTVLGDLIIEGSLVNNGKIVVGTKRSDAHWDSRTMEDVKKFMTLKNLTINGKAVNSGKLEILNGTVYTRPDATFENSGTVTIANTLINTSGFIVTSVKRGDTYGAGTVKNTGTFYLRNTSGTGLHIYGRAKFQNDGKILLGARGTVKGKVSGNAAVKE